MSKRLMIYTAPVAPGGIDSFTTHISRALVQILPSGSWQVSISRKPSSSFKPLTTQTPSSSTAPVAPENKIAEAANLKVESRGFFELVGEDGEPFDLLYLPSPWGMVPMGTTKPIPAPVVMTIHDFEFEDTDYGIITDQYRREAEKFAKLGSAFVFSSEYVRQRAIDLFHFPRERTHVIYQAPTSFTSQTSIDVRQKYGLPERFAFTMDWLSRRKNGAVLVEALGILKQRGLTSLPLVTAGQNFDDILPDNIAHRRYQEHVQERIKELGLTDIHNLGVIDQADVPALIQAAAVVIAPSKSEAGLSYLMLDASALGTPIIHSRIAAVTERLGTDDRYALSFDPYNPEELASKITDILGDESAAKARAENAKTLVGQRTQEDVAREYFDIFKSVSESNWKTRQRQRNHVMRSLEERVAWLIDNAQARESELPMIRQFGLEVYSSKVLPAGTDVHPAAIDYSEDEYSTLPNWVLDRLNQHNFYQNGLDKSIVELLNGYFGTVIISPFNPVTPELLQQYSGRILLRTFGNEQPDVYNAFFTSENNDELWKSIWEAQHRVWFAPRFEGSVPTEAKLIRNRECILPMALPDRFLRSSGQWMGSDKRVLFVCPQTVSDAESSGACHHEFEKHLGHIPHLIGEHQPIQADVPAEMDFVSDDVRQSWFRELRVMFYGGQERHHLEYAPLEAAAHGMPLIYLKGNLIDALMGEGKPGACNTYEEAEQKLLRILNGDDAFTKSVIESQSTLLDAFRPDYVKKIWKERFFNGIMSTSMIPDVIPFAKWQEPSPAIEVSPRPLQPDRHIGTYVLAVTGGGVYKYVTGVVHTAVQMAESKRWRFSLIWGSPTIGQGSYDSPTWEYPKHRLLSILPARSIIFTSNFWTDLKRARPITRWRRSPIYLRYRLLRFGTEAALIPLQYVQGMISQGTLLPDNPQLREEMMTSRMGRRILNMGIVQRIGKLKKGQKNEDVRVDYLKHPPEKSQTVVLPEISSPPLQPYLTLQQINTLKKRYDALLFGNPFRIISPNTPLAPLTRQPVVITMYDLAHEFTEVWDKSAPSVSREMVIWGKLAQKIVFGSEHIRTEAIKRYGIPEANTQIVRPPPLVIRTSRPDANEIQQIKTKLKLPDRYLFNTGFQGSHKNNITIFQAIQILRWRGFDVPPFVIGGGEARRFLTGQVGTGYVIALQKVIKESQLEIGRDIVILDYIEEDDLPAVYAGASVGISMSRSESTVHGMITETMLYGAPIIASTIPQNVEELGTHDEFALLVPPDDPVALADAIEFTLSHPEETAARIKRADTYIHAKTWEKMAGEFLGIFEEIAASRSANK